MAEDSEEYDGSRDGDGGARKEDEVDRARLQWRPDLLSRFRAPVGVPLLVSFVDRLAQSPQPAAMTGEAVFEYRPTYSPWMSAREEGTDWDVFGDEGEQNATGNLGEWEAKRSWENLPVREARRSQQRFVREIMTLRTTTSTNT